MRRLGDMGLWLDQRLGLLDTEPSSGRTEKLDAFQRVFAIVLGTEYWARALPRWHELGALYLAALPVATTLCVVVVAVAAWRRAAFAGLAALHVAVVVAEFPATGNHAYLELALCCLGAALGPSAGEVRLHLRAVRWLTVLILVTSGVQKLVHGYWTTGLYLTFSAWIPTFRPILGMLMPAEDLARLVGYDRALDSGPYLVDSARLVLVSNTVWLGEIVFGLLLLVPAARTVAVAGTVVLLLGIGAGAREVFFGSLFVHMTLLFLPVNVTRMLLLPTAVGMLALLASRLGILPPMTFY